MKKTIYRGHEIEIFTVGTVADSFLGTMKYFGLIDGEGGPQTENFKSAEEALAEAHAEMLRQGFGDAYKQNL